MEVEPTSSSNPDMPVELILRAENKADTIKTEQQYIELQVKLKIASLAAILCCLINRILYLASTAYRWSNLSSYRQTTNTVG